MCGQGVWKAEEQVLAESRGQNIKLSKGGEYGLILNSTQETLMVFLGHDPFQKESQSISSVAQSCLTLCDSMDYSMQASLHQQLLELTLTHVH